jgi:hypothetical protein
MKRTINPEAAVTALLNEDSTEKFAETQDLFFESWLTSNFADGTTGDERALIYSHYKATKRLFKNIACLPRPLLKTISGLV